MAKFNQTRVGGKLFKQLALAAALCTAGVASAGVLTFEGATTPFVNSGEGFTDGTYTVQTFNGLANPGFAGMFIDGTDPSICFGAELKCPSSSSTYYATLADSFTYISLNSRNQFRLESFDASFIGTGGALAYGLVLLQAMDANLNVLGQVQLDLPPPVAGLYGFGNYVLGDAFTMEATYYRFIGYGCPAVGNCVRNMNAANFALDNVVTSGEVPEPATLGMLGLGLLGMGALRRRKQAA